MRSMIVFRISLIIFAKNLIVSPFGFDKSWRGAGGAGGVAAAVAGGEPAGGAGGGGGGGAGALKRVKRSQATTS
jgi:hypothetical protein